MKRLWRVIGSVGCVFILTVARLPGGERSNVRGMGMARTSVVSARGLEAVGINPGDLGVNDSSMLSISLFPIGGHVGTDFLNYGLYTRYFTGVQTDSGRVGRFLTEDDKKVITSSFDKPLARATGDIEITLLGAAYRIADLGCAAFVVSDHVGAFADIPRDYLEFILQGNPAGSAYNFTGTRLQASWTREYSLSVGADIPVGFLESLSVGVAAKLVHGFSYYEVQRFNTSLVTDEQATLTGSIDFLARRAGLDPTSVRFISAYQLFPGVAGKGPGFDVGASGRVNSFLSFAMSVTDIGSIRWTRGTEVQQIDTSMVVDDPLNESQRTMIENAMKGRKSPGAPFTTSLPTTLRVGVAMDVEKMPAMDDFPGNLLVEIDYEQGLVETPFSTRIPRGSLGVEFMPLSWLPLRSGVSFGGADHVNFALGFGLRFYGVEFDLASENVTWLFVPQSFSRGSLAAGLRYTL